MTDRDAATLAGPIAFDALGAEAAPEQVIAGVREVAAEGVAIRLFGPARDYRGAFDDLDAVELIDCVDRIDNEADPIAAVRAQPDASIVRAAADLAAARSIALASPGSTGATLAAALGAVGRMPSVKRPALAVQLPVPGAKRPVLMLDVGANTELRAQHLIQFAYMGAAFYAAVLGNPNPRVALLCNGSEAKKGTPEVVEAHTALAPATLLDFVGNVEGRDLFGGVADVVVCDGFTGNITLKTIEGTAAALSAAIRRAARSNPFSALGGALLKPALGGLRREVDPDTTGGAILLGLRGVVVVGHGSAGRGGIAAMIRLAERSARQRSVEGTSELLTAAGVSRAAIRRDRQRGGDQGVAASGSMSPNRRTSSDE